MKNHPDIALKTLPVRCGMCVRGKFLLQLTKLYPDTQGAHKAAIALKTEERRSEKEAKEKKKKEEDAKEVQDDAVKDEEKKRRRMKKKKAPLNRFKNFFSLKNNAIGVSDHIFFS
jgi:hypothetical protein